MIAKLKTKQEAFGLKRGQEIEVVEHGYCDIHDCKTYKIISTLNVQDIKAVEGTAWLLESDLTFTDV